MERERKIACYLTLYAKLIRLHPAPHWKRFGEEMQQLFCDRLRDCAHEGRSVVLHAAWMFGETSVQLVRQKASLLMRRNRNVIYIALATLALLLVPAVAMQLNDEVDWSVSDFAIVGMAVFGAGLTYELVTRHRRGLMYRCALVIALFSALLLFWINGAVGLIGSESDNFNALYWGVFAIGLVGAGLARFQPSGMAGTMVAMVLAQGCIGAAALLAGMHDGSLVKALEILGVTGLFVALFLAAAWLFRCADRGRAPAGV